MAQINRLSGSVWGIPFDGTLTRLSDADVAMALGAAAGLARFLAFAAGGLALASLAAATFGRLPSPGRGERGSGSRAKWRNIADVKTQDRSFRGSCLDETILLRAEGHTLHIPIDEISLYFPRQKWEKTGLFSTRNFPTATIRMRDSSQYTGELIGIKKFTFITPIGLQYVDLANDHNICGGAVKDADKLKANIDDYLASNSKKVIDIIGTDEFDRHFQNM